MPRGQAPGHTTLHLRGREGRLLKSPSKTSQHLVQSKHSSWRVLTFSFPLRYNSHTINSPFWNVPLSVFQSSQMSNHHTTAFQFYLLITPAKNPILFTVASPPPFPESPITTHLLNLYCSVYSGHFIQMESYDMWCWVPCIFQQHDGFKVHPQWSKYFISFHCWSMVRICPSISCWPSPCCCCCLAANLYLTLVNPWTIARQVPLSTGFPRNNTGVGCCFLLQGIFPTQGSNVGLLLGRQILLNFKKFLNIQKSWKNSKPYTPTAFIYILSSFSVHIQNTLVLIILVLLILLY